MYQGMHIESAPYLTISFLVKVTGIGMEFKENIMILQIVYADFITFKFNFVVVKTKSESGSLNP